MQLPSLLDYLFSLKKLFIGQVADLHFVFPPMFDLSVLQGFPRLAEKAL